MMTPNTKSVTKTVFHRTSNGILVLDLENVIRRCNRAAERLLDAAPGELVGKNVSWIFAENDRRAPHNLVSFNVNRFWSVGGKDKEVWLRSQLGRNFPAEVEIIAALDKGKDVSVFRFEDVTAKRTSQHVIERWEEYSNNVLRNTIEVLGYTVAQRDPYTAHHQFRVSELSTAIGEHIGLSTEDITGLEFGGLIHDIGKIHIPGEILTRPGRFSKEEFDFVKTHSVIGHSIISIIDLPWPVADIAHQHHERLDGTGYPQGLKGTEINRLARITAVSDVMESMTSHRPYRPGLGTDRALSELTSNKGTKYDPDAVDACVSLFEASSFQWSETRKIGTNWTSQSEISAKPAQAG